MANRKVEVFTAGCPACEPVVEMVKSMACEYCDVTVYSVAEKRDGVNDMIKQYGISSLPAVVVDGRLLGENTAVKREELSRAGIGKATA